jgi:hypothetical protein
MIVHGFGIVDLNPTHRRDVFGVQIYTWASSSLVVPSCPHHRINPSGREIYFLISHNIVHEYT